MYTPFLIGFNQQYEPYAHFRYWTISNNFNSENFDSLKRYDSTEVDRRTWLHEVTQIIKDQEIVTLILTHNDVIYIFKKDSDSIIIIFCHNLLIRQREDIYSWDS